MRNSFQKALKLIFLAIFVFQMKEALEKFIYKPVINTGLVKSVNQIQPPVIYICIQDQYDYIKGRQFSLKKKSHNTILILSLKHVSK